VPPEPRDGAADARGPEVGVTDDVLWQRLFGDDVGNGQTSAALEETRGFLEDSALVGRQIDHTV